MRAHRVPRLGCRYRPVHRRRGDRCLDQRRPADARTGSRRGRRRRRSRAPGDVRGFRRPRARRRGRRRDRRSHGSPHVRRRPGGDDDSRRARLRSSCDRLSGGGRCRHRRGGGGRSRLRRRRGRGSRRGRRGRGRRRRRGRRGSGLRSRRRRGGRGQERERIDVALVLRRHAHAHGHIRGVVRERAARPDRADRRALGHGRVLRDGDRPEMRERDRIPVGRLNRHRFAARGHRAGEADGAARGCDDGCPGGSADVDAAVLAARIRVRWVEREPLQHGSVHGPGPRSRRGSPEPEQYDDEDEPPHGSTALVVRLVNEAGTVAAPSDVVNIGYSEPR